MTIREKICASGVNTLREYMCLEAGTGNCVDRLVPYNDIILNIETAQMSADVKSDTMSVDIKTSTMSVDIEKRIIEIDIQTDNMDVDICKT